MARVKRGTKARARRKKVLKRAKGYYGSNSRLFVTAQEVVDRALVYAYRDRKVRKCFLRKGKLDRLFYRQSVSCFPLGVEGRCRHSSAQVSDVRRCGVCSSMIEHRRVIAAARRKSFSLKGVEGNSR